MFFLLSMCCLDLDLAKYIPHIKPNPQALTFFTPISYSPVSNTTILRCFPYTGRMHQIRVHLQHLGHSIIGDPLYGPKATSNDTIESNQTSIKNREDIIRATHTDQSTSINTSEKPGHDPTCHQCRNPMPDPEVEEMGLKLHAVKVCVF